MEAEGQLQFSQEPITGPSPDEDGFDSQAPTLFPLD